MTMFRSVSSHDRGRGPLVRLLLVLILFACANIWGSAQAARARFAGIEDIWQKPASGSSEVAEFGLSLQSSARLPRQQRLRFLDKLGDGLLYISRVQIGDKIFYRLVYGEYDSEAEARKDLERIREWFPGGWVVSRDKAERKELQRLLSTGRRASSPLTLVAPTPPKTVVKPRSKPASADVELADKLLEQARQSLIDGKLQQVRRFADKLLEIGNDEQRQKAMELAGIARERERKFAQAIRIYRDFLAEYPDSELAPRIRSRLHGLLTMRQEPRKKLARKAPRKKEPWSYYGIFSQYYRHDTLDQQDAGSQNTGSLLTTDLDVTARRRGDDDSWQLRFNGGFNNDFTNNKTETQVSRAEVRYQNDIGDYEVIGGRQSRTISGLSGRVDGVVFSQSNPQAFDYSLFAGFPVQSSAESSDTEHWFVGGGLKLRPRERLTLDSYLYLQQAWGLTDRQTAGVEWQYRADKGFLFGSFEYDFFFQEVDHFSLVSNYRPGNDWVLNLNWDYRYSPVLSMLSALQGQTVTTLDELKQSYSEDEIRQIALDRTARNQTIFVGASYSFDLNRLLSLNLSWSRTDATTASAGVEANPDSSETQVSADYSFKGWFTHEDFATWGLRLSDSDTISQVSLQARSRIPARIKQLFYTPRLRLDHRSNKNDDVKQWILAPEIKVSYKPSRNLSLEASFGFEYSDFNLPELNDQTAYSLYLSYFYQF